MKGAPRNGLLDIGEVIQNGIVFNLRNWGDQSVDMQNLPQTVERLFALLEARKIEYVLVGGLAMLQYVEGRNTQDIDFIASSEAPSLLPEVEILERQDDFARARFAGLRVDFLFTSHRLFKLVMQSHSTIQPFAGRNIRCATREGMLLLKFFALPSLYRQGRLQRAATYEHDIQMLLLSQDVKLDPLFEILAQSLSASDLTEIRRIAAEIRDRIRHF